MKTTKCKECNGDTFFVQEVIFYCASVCAETGALIIYKNRTNEIERIFCQKCEKDYSVDDFKEIIFS